MTPKSTYYFPFGLPLSKVQQCDRSPKKAFVLGVYASAVHARWIDKRGKEKVKALAVASEPSIFWRGENAETIISNIKVPAELGQLTAPKDKNLNGPSGRALDEYFLNPLKLDRNTTWLCDLLPESRVNEKQRAAIDKYYTKEIIDEFNLSPATIPNFDKSELDSITRRQEILNELQSSRAETLLLLGDLPIRWFLRFYERKYSKLSDFGDSKATYGRAHKIKIANKHYNIIPLCHPRQANRLGNSSVKWELLHDYWITQTFRKYNNDIC